MDTIHPHFIIVNFNSGERLDACITSIFHATQNLPHKNIIIVDNASTDNSFSFIKEKFPKFTYIASGENRGFGSGANIGIKRAQGMQAQQFFFVNPDAILDGNCINVLSEVLREDARVGLVAPVIMTTDTKPRIWFSGGTIDWLKQRVEHRTDSLTGTLRRPTAFVTGCVFGVNKAFLEEVGLFDERFFLYYEDADLSVRSEEAGFANIVVADARAFHEEQSELLGEQKLYYLVLSGLLFFHKHAHGLALVRFRFVLLLRKLKNAYNRQKNEEHADTIYQALSDYDRGHTHNFNTDRQL